jgi:hypothetical protein
MACKKCGYQDKKEVKVFGSPLCSVCKTFAPPFLPEFQNYVSEKIDWKHLDSFRRFGHSAGHKRKNAMAKKALKGNLMCRPAKGYDYIEGKLIPNPDASKIHSLFKTFLNRDYSLNSMAKNFGLSVNGIKKILTNRTYLGEIKFDGKIHKGYHPAIISPEIFYATQRKLKDYLRPKKKLNNYI